MFENYNTVKLFDSNHNFVDNFDEEIEKILISVHGENYYDTDEDYQEVKDEIYKDSELEKTMEFVSNMVAVDAPKIEIQEKKEKKHSIKDIIPVIFFMLIFAVLVVAGYYFLSSFDLMGLVK